MAAHAEIPFAAATTGPANLLASAIFRDSEHLYAYLTGELAALPGGDLGTDGADHPDAQAHGFGPLGRAWGGARRAERREHSPPNR